MATSTKARPTGTVKERTELARAARAAREANANGGSGVPSGKADPGLLAGISTVPAAKRGARKPTVVVGLDGKPSDARGNAAVVRSRKATADAKAAPKAPAAPKATRGRKAPAPKADPTPAPAASATRGPSKSEAKADLVRRVLIGIEASLAELPDDSLALSVYSREEAGAAIAAMIHHFPAGRNADGKRWWPEDGAGALPFPDRSDWR